jgi:hypothetical protein
MMCVRTVTCMTCTRTVTTTTRMMTVTATMMTGTIWISVVIVVAERQKDPLTNSHSL